MLVGPNLASTAEGAQSAKRALLRGSGGMHPQKNFEFQPHLERFWLVLVVCSSRLSMGSNLRVSMSGWLGADSPRSELNEESG